MAAARPLPPVMMARIPRIRKVLLAKTGLVLWILPEWSWVVCRSRGAGFWRVGCGVGGMGLGFLVEGDGFLLLGRSDSFFGDT